MRGPLLVLLLPLMLAACDLYQVYGAPPYDRVEVVFEPIANTRAERDAAANEMCGQRGRQAELEEHRQFPPMGTQSIGYYRCVDKTEDAG